MKIKNFWNVSKKPNLLETFQKRFHADGEWMPRQFCNLELYEQKEMKKWWLNCCNFVSNYLRKLRYIFLIPNLLIFSSPTRPSQMWIFTCNKRIRDTHKSYIKQRNNASNKSTDASNKWHFFFTSRLESRACEARYSKRGKPV